MSISQKLNSVLKLRKESNLSKKDFINSFQALNVVKLAQEHIKYIAFQCFRDELPQIKCAKLKRQMTLLCILYGL